MSELTDCTNSLTARDIIRGAARKGPPFYINALGLSSFCTQYKAVYDFFVTPPDAAIAANQNIFACGVYEDGIWDKLDIIQMYAQTTEAGGETTPNWINPGTNTATLVGAPAFVALEGYTGANSKYINTNWNPAVHGSNYTQNSACYGVYIRQSVNDGTAADCGINDGTSRAYMNSRLSGTNTRVYVNDTAATAHVHSDWTGMFAAQRTASNVQQIWKNGLKVDEEADTSVALPNGNVFVLCYNSSGSPGGYNQKQISIFFAGSLLTPTEHLALYNRFQTYMTSNGKQV